MKRLTFAFSLLILLCLSCASTPYRGIPASKLTDNQLVEELRYVYKELGVSTSNLNSAILNRPAPQYKITATSFTDMSWNTNYYGNTSYSKGTATTTTNYQVRQNYNDPATVGYNAGLMVARLTVDSLNKRRKELEPELDRRIAQQEAQEREDQNVMKNFYAAHPSFYNEIPLLQAILPWEETENYKETLNRIAFEAETVLASRSTGGVSGKWYGNLLVREQGAGTYTDPTTLLVRGNIDDTETSTKMDLVFQSGAPVNVIGVINENIFQGKVYFKDKSNNLLFSAPLKGTATNREVRLFIEKNEGDGKTLNGILSLSR